MPPDIEKEIRNLYLSLLELLKHFWKCFPPTTPQLEAQAIRMHETLQRFSMAKLKPFEVSIPHYITLFLRRVSRVVAG